MEWVFVVVLFHIVAFRIETFDSEQTAVEEFELRRRVISSLVKTWC